MDLTLKKRGVTSNNTPLDKWNYFWKKLFTTLKYFVTKNYL